MTGLLAMPVLLQAMSPTLPTPTLAWRPFLDPLPAEAFWFWLALPLVFLLSWVYKAIRMREGDRILRPALGMAVQILLTMLVVAAVVWLIGQLF